MHTDADYFGMSTMANNFGDIFGCLIMRSWYINLEPESVADSKSIASEKRLSTTPSSLIFIHNVVLSPPLYWLADLDVGFLM